MEILTPMSKNELKSLLTHVNVSQFTYVEFECFKSASEEIWKPDGYRARMYITYTKYGSRQPLTLEELADNIDNLNIGQIVNIKLKGDAGKAVKVDLNGNSIELNNHPTVDLEVLINLKLREIKINNE